MAWFHPKTVQDRDAAQKVLLCLAGLGGREVDRAHVLELSDSGAVAHADEARENNDETDGLPHILPLARWMVVSGLGLTISARPTSHDPPSVRDRPLFLSVASPTGAPRGDPTGFIRDDRTSSLASWTTPVGR